MLINPSKYVLYNLLIVVVLMFNSSSAYAASSGKSYFNFKPSKPFTDNKKTITLALLYDLGTISESRFRFRPYSEKSSIKIKSTPNIDANALWTLMPILTDTVKIEFVGNFISTNLWLAVLDTKTGKVYETPKHKIWNGEILSNYLESLNANILK